MSVQASAWVIEHSKHKGSELLCLLMIANHAHSDGSNAFPSIDTLARECRMSGRQITRIIQHLEASGELCIDRSQGRSTHVYRVPMGETNPDKLTGRAKPTLTNPTPNPDKSRAPTLTNPTPNPDITVSPPSEPSLEPSLEPVAADAAPPGKADTRIPLDLFRRGYSELFGEEPEIRRRHALGLIQRYRTCGPAKFPHVLKAYLQSDDDFAVKNGHDVATFLIGTDDRWLRGGKGRASPRNGQGGTLEDSVARNLAAVTGVRR